MADNGNETPQNKAFTNETPNMTEEDQEASDRRNEVKLLQENMARLKKQFADLKKELAMEAALRGIPKKDYGLKDDSVS